MFLKIQQQNKDIFLKDVFQQLQTIKDENDLEVILLSAQEKVKDEMKQKQDEIESFNLHLSNEDAIKEVRKEISITIQFPQLQEINEVTRRLIKLNMDEDDYFDAFHQNDSVSLDFNQYVGTYSIENIELLIKTNEWTEIILFNRKNPISNGFIRIYPSLLNM